MQRTNALKRMLHDLTAVYNDGEKVDVELSTPEEGSYAAHDGSHVAVTTNVRGSLGRNLSGANELRVVVDTLSHEVEHIRESELTGKQEISEEYAPNGRLAGAVANILEDQYIDRTRTERFRGLRKAHAFKIDAVMQNHHRRPRLDSVDDLGAELVEGFTQVAFAGFAKGIKDASPEVREFLAWARPKIDEARHEDDPDVRLDIAREVTDKILTYIPDAEEREAANERASENAGGGSDGITDELPDEAHEQGGQDDADADDLSKEEARELLENLDPDGDDQDGDDANALDLDDVLEQAEMDADDLDIDLDDLPTSSGDDAADGDEASETDALDADDADDTADSNDAGDDDGRGDDDNVGGDEPVSDELADELEQMERMDESRKSGEWFGLAEDDDYETDAEFEQRHERLEREVQRDQTDLGRRKSERDDRMENAPDFATSDEIRAKLRETGLAEEVIEAFNALKTRDRDVPSRSGPRIHTRNAIRHLSGATSERRVYERTLRAESGDRTVCVSADLSGSMDVYALKVAMGALHLATREIGDELIMSGWTDGSNGLALPLVKGPSEEFDWAQLDSIDTGGATPTASGIEDAIALVDEGTRREDVIIVITDGKPNRGLDGMHNPISDASAMVNEARQNGIKVIGLGVGRVRQSTMGEMFGEDGFVMADMDNLAEKLVEVYMSQMKVSETPTL